MLQQYLFPLLVQLLFAAFAAAAPVDGSVHAMSPTAQWGTGGGIVGFIVLILDIVVWVEVLKSNRPPLNKLLWCVGVFLFPIVGIVLYWLFSNRSAHNTYEPIG